MPSRPLNRQDRFQCPFLIGVEQQVRLAGRRSGRRGKRRFATAYGANQPFLTQGRQRSGPQSAARVNSAASMGRPAEDRTSSTALLLAGETRDRRVVHRPFDRDERRHHASSGAMLHSGRDDGLEHLPPTAQVVIGDPPREPEHVGRQDWLAIDDRVDCLEAFALRRRLDTDGHAIADGQTVSFPERGALTRWPGTIRPRSSSGTR